MVRLEFCLVAFRCGGEAVTHCIAPESTSTQSQEPRQVSTHSPEQARHTPRGRSPARTLPPLSGLPPGPCGAAEPQPPPCAACESPLTGSPVKLPPGASPCGAAEPRPPPPALCKPPLADAPAPVAAATDSSASPCTTGSTGAASAASAAPAGSGPLLGLPLFCTPAPGTLLAAAARPAKAAAAATARACARGARAPNQAGRPPAAPATRAA